LANGGICLYVLSIMKGAFSTPHAQDTISIFLMIWSTTLLILSIAGLLRANRRKDFPTDIPRDYSGEPTWNMLLREKAWLFVFMWMAQMVTSIVGFVGHDPQYLLIQTVSIMAFVIIAVCANECFQDMARRSRSCPMTLVPGSIVRRVRYFDQFFPCRSTDSRGEPRSGCHIESTSRTRTTLDNQEQTSSPIELKLFKEVDYADADLKPPPPTASFGPPSPSTSSAPLSPILELKSYPYPHPYASSLPTLDEGESLQSHQ